jgi:hypothetical protein
MPSEGAPYPAEEPNNPKAHLQEHFIVLEMPLDLFQGNCQLDI